MIKLGQVSTKTKGVVIFGFIEDLVTCAPGSYFPKCFFGTGWTPAG